MNDIIVAVIIFICQLLSVILVFQIDVLLHKIHIYLLGCNLLIEALGTYSHIVG